MPGWNALKQFVYVFFLSVGILVASAGASGQKTLHSEAVTGGYHMTLPLGLSADDFYVPQDNPLTREKVDLGWTLFFDKRLSSDSSVACATCHIPRYAFTDKQRVSTGVDGALGRRNAPSVINRIALSVQFRDGRAASLEEQAKGPLINPLEMGMRDYQAVVDRVTAIAGYRKLFQEVFENSPNIEDLVRAIASFERTLVSGNSRWDQFMAGNPDALSSAEKSGLAVFLGKGRCSQCHTGWNFTDEKFHNLGIGWDTREPDWGRYRITSDESDIGAFRTPTLREISLTSPYMHDGRFDTLEQVVDYYDSGVIANPHLDPELRRSGMSLDEMLHLYEVKQDPAAGVEFPVQRLELTRREKADLIAYMNSLEGEGWQSVHSPGTFPQ